MLAHKLTEKLAEVRKKGKVDYLRPDGKSQVTIEYHGRPPEAHRCRRDFQPAQRQSSRRRLKDVVMKEVIKPVLPAEMVDKNTKYPHQSDRTLRYRRTDGRCGLTGRKIIVDTYGGYSRHGGGALSGKDATKVDRSACYMARYVAKNHRRRRPRHQSRSAAGLRHRRCRTGFSDGRYFRHRHDSQRADHRTGPRRFSSSRRRASSKRSTFAVRFTAPPPPTATSAAAGPASRGRTPTRPTRIRKEAAAVVRRHAQLIARNALLR